MRVESMALVVLVPNDSPDASPVVVVVVVVEVVHWGPLVVAGGMSVCAGVAACSASTRPSCTCDGMHMQRRKL